AFPRYASDTITLAKQAGDQGCQVLALTDSPTSPLAPLADIALYARPERQFSATSDTAAVALFEALCGAVAHRSAHSLESAERLTEFVLPWLHTGQASRANAAQGNDAANAPTTTRRGRKRTAEN
ncbi:MAG: MurR/RpiR family transcriptional regulator, partial [Betaproteobacteria bacterium]|nr:MurR/RpiR family transcriptional regulator [Betaproteobacteria bacterium]